MPGTARATFLVRLRPLHDRLPVPHIRQPRPLRRLPALWLLQSASIAAYTLIIACCLPAYWLHPFAPLIKNLPLLALTVYFYQQTRSS